MSSVCDNVLFLSHPDPSRLKAAITAYKESRLLSHFDPIPTPMSPAEVAPLKLQRWGCRSDVDFRFAMEPVEMPDGSFKLVFDTPWTPPVGVYERMENAGYKVDGFYLEAGNRMAGSYGNRCDSRHTDWGNAKELPSIFAEMFDLESNFPDDYANEVNSERG